MGKIGQTSTKYVIRADIIIEGVVNKPDVIGAIFGQTEGLLGSELELRELQRSGRIGRIEVQTQTTSGKTTGTIDLPCSLDKAETAIIAAALEVIQRIGPCNAKLTVLNIEDVRTSKRNKVVSRAKQLLKQMMSDSMPDSQEIADEVMYSVRIMEIKEFGRSRLACGPLIEEAQEIIVVEGRADVINLLKHGFKNVIAANGTSAPPEIIELGKRKTITLFTDGDRGGRLIIEELTSLTDIDFVAVAPDGKEVEELTKKEIHKSLRNKVAKDQIMGQNASYHMSRHQRDNRSQINAEITHNKKRELSQLHRQTFKEMLEDLIGTRGAYVLDGDLKVIGKVPISELSTTLLSLDSQIFAVIFDGIIDKKMLDIADKTNLSFLVGMDNNVKGTGTNVSLFTAEQF